MTSAALSPVYDVLIAGAGAAGLSLAAAVKGALGAGARVAVADPVHAERAEHLRAVAIAAGPRRLLDGVGAWEALAPKTQPILEMTVMDGGVRDAVRLPHLRFEAEEGKPLAHMAFSADVVAALAAACETLGVERIEAGVETYAAGPANARVRLTGIGEVRARLVVAADGNRSKLRALADIASVGWDYDQSGIVATIAHEREHGGRAEQHFLPAGPFAILPLPGRFSSIVWNETRRDAAALLALDADDLVRQLEYRFTPKLGAISLASPAEAFPLGFRIARRFVAERLALVGDAAHLVHPLAGQGLNLGLRDVAALAETIAERMRLGLDPGAADALGEYERARRFDVAASGLSMDALNRLFSNDIAPLRILRDLGLRLVDRAPSLKSFFIAEAAGARRGAPRLLQGLAL